ncbi:MAG: hypothetical protein ACPGJF_05735 [Sinimarinibacterium flocculans]|uniref:hypothetical protein n=1 Tax=Sinimarinibacterium flocculans TaxID=985250 RepID=UPI003C478F58
MKVPYLKKRMTKEFVSYLSEFSEAISAATKDASQNTDSMRLFSALFPLFTLIRELTENRYVRDPSRDLVLSRIRASGNKQIFLKVLNTRPASDEAHRHLQEALREQAFTAYLGELWSDSLLCLNCYYGRNYRGAQIALRCMLEDLYRHLYYKDHPEEHWALNEGPNARSEKGPRVSELRIYLGSVSYLSVFKGITTAFAPKTAPSDADLFTVNEHLYAVTSGYVHCARKDTMNSFKSNGDAIYDKAKADEMVSIVTQFVRMAVPLLIAAHLDHFLAFNEYEKSMILDTFSVSERGALRAALNC